MPDRADNPVSEFLATLQGAIEDLSRNIAHRQLDAVESDLAFLGGALWSAYEGAQAHAVGLRHVPEVPALQHVVATGEISNIAFLQNVRDFYYELGIMARVVSQFDGETSDASFNTLAAMLYGAVMKARLLTLQWQVLRLTLSNDRELPEVPIRRIDHLSFTEIAELCEPRIDDLDDFRTWMPPPDLSPRVGALSD